MGTGIDIIKSTNATIPDPPHTSRGLLIFHGSVCLVSLTYMSDKHLMWYLPDPQHILLTLDFYSMRRHLTDPLHVYMGSRYVAVLFATHPQHTLWERHRHHKIFNVTLPDPQHTSCGLSIYRGSVRLIYPTYMPVIHKVIFTRPPTYSVYSWFVMYNTTFRWSPARVFGIQTYRGFAHRLPTVFTMRKGADII